MPHEIPEAVRSRCVEIFFRELTPDEIGIIASNAAEKINFELSGEALETIKKFAKNGREAVNIVQIAASLADIELRKNIEASDVEWIINHGQYSPRIITKVPKRPQIGYANGLAMYGPSMGVLLEVEVSAVSAFYKKGIINITGIVEEEEMGLEGKKIRRKSMVKSSLENVLTALRINFNIEPRDYNLHVNFPGDIPIDGPSAGAAVAAAVYSAVKGIPVDNTVAMTGEVSIKGSILPVGGIAAKINAARNAGAKKVLIPRDNWQHLFQKFKDIDIVPIDNVKNLIKEALIFPADASLSAFGFGEKAGL